MYEYFLNRSHEKVLALAVFFHFDHFVEYLIEILLILFFLLIVNNLLQCVEMVVLEHVRLELVQRLSTKRTPVMSINSLFNAMFAVHMTATRYVAVCDGVETDCALEFVLEFVGADAEGIIVELFGIHFGNSLLFLYY